MRNILRFSCLASALLFALAAAAQMPPHAVSPVAPPPVPVPRALLAAQTVFISNAGADSGLFPSPFSGDPDRAYQQFYAAIQSWQRYRLVGVGLSNFREPDNPEESPTQSALFS